ncbi:MAG TPA: DUF2157 domain-containing protein [Bauldia sp.]|nr:DUF2157 domain-containing protein [Bauldia sp.]
MQDAAYRRRLADDLPKWLDAGWVTAGGASAILAAVDGEPGGRRATFSLSAILGTLGALLLGLAVIAYVGAQWEAVPRVARLAAIALALLVAYVAAFEFDRRGHRIFAEAGVLAAGLVYAGAIALVGQAYHLSGDFAGAVMLFEAGILGAALFTGSPTLIILGLTGAGYWTWLATGQGIVPHWPSLAAIVLGIVVATLQRAHYGRIIAICALMFWMALTLLTLGHQHDWSFLGGVTAFATVSLAFFGVGAMLASFGRVPRIAALGDATLWPSLLAVLITLGGLQTTHHPLHAGEDVWNVVVAAGAVAVIATGIATLARLMTMLDFLAVLVLTAATMAFAFFQPEDEIVRNACGGAIVIVAAVWAVVLGQSGRHPIGKAFGLAAFGLEVIYIYVFTIGSRIDTALAFLIGGVLFIVLAYVLFRIDRVLARRSAAAAIVADLKLETPLPTAPPASATAAEPLVTPAGEAPDDTPQPPPTTSSPDPGGTP